eukprot:TRINITY_DN124065_c0_g1_i1.p1 TRINITY_DN124065_c0_g1~~TRINITY_DN124065_c0_g1_i1.p1  ORF type:complete len:173 (-),score=25.27 TRINITY_DN124065_c0_g1_i1:174-692(-)
MEADSALVSMRECFDCETDVNYESTNIAEYWVATEEEAQERFMDHPEAAAYSFWAEKTDEWAKNCFIRRTATEEVREEIKGVFSGKPKRLLIELTGSSMDSNKIQVHCTTVAGEKLADLTVDQQLTQVANWLPGKVAALMDRHYNFLCFVLPDGGTLAEAPADATIAQLLSL